MLRWDMAVMMPDKSGPARGEQITALKLIAHEILSSNELADLLAAAEDTSDALDDWQTRNLQLMRRRWVHTTAVPADLLDAFTRTCMQTESVWRTARTDNDFGAILPHLETLLGLVRETATAKSEVLGVPPYEALLDLYEPGGRTAQLDALFDDYATFLPLFLERVLERQSFLPQPRLPNGPFPQVRQEDLCRRMAEAVGFDFTTGRLDATLHPFSGGIPEDSRITTRYDEADFTSALMGVLHETGHAMYERGRPQIGAISPSGHTGPWDAREPIVDDRDAGQSIAGLLDWAAPVMQSAFDGSGEGWGAGNFIASRPRSPKFHPCRCRRSHLSSACNLTVPLERAMIDGDLQPRIFPAPGKIK